MEKLIFTNSRDEKIEFGYYGIPYEDLEGLGDVGASIQSQKIPYQDGEEVIDVLLEKRLISFKCVLEGNSDEEISNKREMLGKIFNPKLGLGTLEYHNGNVKREIKVIAEHIPTYSSAIESRTNWYQDALIDLIAPNPYWKSSEITEEPAFKPLFKWPFLNSEQFQMGLQQIERNIYNDGDAPAPIEIEFSGPALNPYVRNNTTGEFIRVKQELLEGEKMLIDTADGKKKVVFVGVDGVERNVFHWIDLSNGGSTFFKLQIGMNEITYGADSLIETNIVDMRYQKQYNAV